MKLNEIKMLQESKFLTDSSEIYRWLTMNHIVRADPKNLGCKLHNVIIHDNGVVDLGTVERSAYEQIKKQLKEIKVQFGKCKGRFNMGYNDLPSFEGFPYDVKMECIVTGNKRIQSFEGCPRNIGQGLEIGGTGITSFVGITKHVDTMSWLQCNFDDIIEGGLELINIKSLTALVNKRAGQGNIHPLPAPFQIIEKYLGKPDMIFECQNELIEAGYEEYAKL